MFVKCLRNDCAHNKNQNECYAYTIAMKGRSARESQETHCASFLRRPTDNQAEFSEELTNSTRSRANTGTIECEASFCVFNREHTCFAEDVDISKVGPSCLTFRTT